MAKDRLPFLETSPLGGDPSAYGPTNHERPLCFKRSPDVLLYEDDCALADEIEVACRDSSLMVVRVFNNQDFQSAIETECAGVVVLNRLNTGCDRIGLVKAMREQGYRVPVIVISRLASVEERIFGLKAGADDYLAKPFFAAELIARIQALLRRVVDARKTKLLAGPLAIDLIDRTVLIHERHIDLLPREFKLLEYLVRHRGQPIARTTLLEAVWKYKCSTETNVIDVYIGNLRRKLATEEDSLRIESIRGVGFRFSATPQLRS